MSRQFRASRYLLILLITALGIGLLELSWPRLRASILYLPIDTAIARHWKGDTIAPEQLRALADRARVVLVNHDHYRYWDGLSLLNYQLASSPGELPAERREALETSASAAVETLRRAPMKPMTWLRLAAARDALGRPGEEVVTALNMSVFTGRVEPVMLPLRLQLGYSHLRHLDAEGRHLLRDQTLLTWELQKRPFLAMLRSGSVLFSDVEQVLAGRHNDVLEDMEVRLARAFQ